MPSCSNLDFSYISYQQVSLNEKEEVIILTSDGTLFREGVKVWIRKNIVLI